MKFNQPDELRRLIRAGESETLEFKQQVADAAKIARTLAAFANTRRGKIIVGITDAQEAIGIDPEEEKYMIQTAASAYCKPPPNLTFSEQELDGAPLLIVDVPESAHKPHYALDENGRHYFCRRINDKNACKLINNSNF